MSESESESEVLELLEDQAEVKKKVVKGKGKAARLNKIQELEEHIIEQTLAEEEASTKVDEYGYAPDPEPNSEEDEHGVLVVDKKKKRKAASAVDVKKVLKRLKKKHRTPAVEEEVSQKKLKLMKQLAKIEADEEKAIYHSSLNGSDEEDDEAEESEGDGESEVSTEEEPEGEDCESEEDTVKSKAKNKSLKAITSKSAIKHLTSDPKQSNGTSETFLDPHPPFPKKKETKTGRVASKKKSTAKAKKVLSPVQEDDDEDVTEEEEEEEESGEEEEPPKKKSKPVANGKGKTKKKTELKEEKSNKNKEEATTFIIPAVGKEFECRGYTYRVLSHPKKADVVPIDDAGDIIQEELRLKHYSTVECLDQVFEPWDQFDYFLFSTTFEPAPVSEAQAIAVYNSLRPPKATKPTQAQMEAKRNAIKYFNRRVNQQNATVGCLFPKSLYLKWRREMTRTQEATKWYGVSLAPLNIALYKDYLEQKDDHEKFFEESAMRAAMLRKVTDALKPTKKSKVPNLLNAGKILNSQDEFCMVTGDDKLYEALDYFAGKAQAFDEPFANEIRAFRGELNKKFNNIQTKFFTSYKQLLPYIDENCRMLATNDLRRRNNEMKAAGKGDRTKKELLSEERIKSAEETEAEHMELVTQKVAAKRKVEEDDEEEAELT